MVFIDERYPNYNKLMFYTDVKQCISLKKNVLDSITGRLIEQKIKKSTLVSFFEK